MGLNLRFCSSYLVWKKYDIHYTHIADAAAPGLMLAYGIGRLGVILQAMDAGVNLIHVTFLNKLVFYQIGFGTMTTKMQ